MHLKFLSDRGSPYFQILSLTECSRPLNNFYNAWNNQLFQLNSLLQFNLFLVLDAWRAIKNILRMKECIDKQYLVVNTFRYPTVL